MKKFIKYLQSISLTEKDKSLLRYRIQEFISFNPIRGEIKIPKKSFYFSIFTLRALSKGVALVLVFLIVVGGTGVSYASNEALPGDALYPVKINIKENIEEKLTLTTDAKIKVQSANVERRLTEAQELADKKELSPENKIIVQENLKKNVEKVAKTISTLKDEGKIEEALDATSKITPVLEAHKEILVERSAKEDEEKQDSTTMSMKIEVIAETDTLLESVNAAIKQVEKVEEEIIEKATENKKSADEMTEKNAVEVGQKIEDIKKENSISTKTEEEEISDTTVEKIDTLSTNEGNVEDPSLMKITTVQDSVVSIEIKTESDIEIKVKHAEELLESADKEKKFGNYKEALILSQEARKIIQQIEEYRKIKDIEIESSLETKNEVNIKDSITIPQTPATIEETPTVKPTTDSTFEIPTVDLKAEAIKSIEETNESFKKLNLNLTVQTHL